VPRYRTGAANWNEVRRWNRLAATGEFAGQAGFWPVFSASQADIFDNEVPATWRTDFWTLVRDCPRLTFQIVTKRIGNARLMLPADWENGYPNVWLLSTVVTQQEAERDIPKLLRVPAALHGLSIEPLLGPIDLGGWLGPAAPCIDWVLAGGESGSGARPMELSWVRALRDRCTAAGVPFLFKQWGEWAPADPSESNPGGGPRRVGRQAAGRLLDGRDWTEFPRAHPQRQSPL
jgi:protein gp37